MFARKKKVETKPPVSQDEINDCLAKAVADGDMVNLKFAFTPNSPLRQESPEPLQSDKYRYLRSHETERGARYREALALVQRADIQDHHNNELAAKRPARLHADVVMATADNAVRFEKYTVAAQAYETLRIREPMREEYAKQADAALESGDLKKAVRGYRIAVGLSYDYAAFPEPSPLVPNYQSRALMLHAVYPRKPEESIAMLPPDKQVVAALNYLLLDGELAARLQGRSVGVLVDFIAEYVRLRDPQWDAFAARYREACDLVTEYNEKVKALRTDEQQGSEQLREDIAMQDEDIDPMQIPARLLGRTIEDGEWWQYLKDLAYQHPAAVLFVARQMAWRDQEIITPRFHPGAPLGKALGLYDGNA